VGRAQLDACRTEAHGRLIVPVGKGKSTKLRTDDGDDVAWPDNGGVARSAHEVDALFGHRRDQVLERWVRRLRPHELGHLAHVHDRLFVPPLALPRTTIIRAGAPLRWAIARSVAPGSRGANRQFVRGAVIDAHRQVPWDVPAVLGIFPQQVVDPCAGEHV